MTHAHSLSSRRFFARTIVAVLLVLGTIHCSSGSSSSASSSDGCSTVCACVTSKGGDHDNCMSQCAGIIAKTTNAKSDCESSLAANGYSSCNSTCSAFAGSATSGG